MVGERPVLQIFLQRFDILASNGPDRSPTEPVAQVLDAGVLLAPTCLAFAVVPSLEITILRGIELFMVTLTVPIGGLQDYDSGQSECENAESW